jgi:hypothetical protein
VWKWCGFLNIKTAYIRDKLFKKFHSIFLDRVMKFV